VGAGRNNTSLEQGRGLNLWKIRMNEAC